MVFNPILMFIVSVVGITFHYYAIKVKCFNPAIQRRYIRLRELIWFDLLAWWISILFLSCLEITFTYGELSHKTQDIIVFSFMLFFFVMQFLSRNDTNKFLDTHLDSVNRAYATFYGLLIVRTYLSSSVVFSVAYIVFKFVLEGV